ncbi:MAG TPA: hypothetical protein VNT03_17260 [Baekduia sp.]|nr:hypothetical protein [Baekduia sp.]
MDDDALVATRRSLHALAEQVLAPLRVQATGNEIALQVRPQGFGTPDLPEGGWVGVCGTDVVHVAPDGARMAAAITSLRAAARFVGLAEEVAALLTEEPLEIHAGAAAVLADTWARGEQALAALLADAAAGDDPSPIHLWPEHFDIAAELGAGALRATYGVSPGDDDHEEPYAYIGPWTTPATTGPATFWNAVGFTGAQRPADDPDEILAFFREGRRLITGQPPRPPAARGG